MSFRPLSDARFAVFLCLPQIVQTRQLTPRKRPLAYIKHSPPQLKHGPMGWVGWSGVMVDGGKGDGLVVDGLTVDG